MIKQTPTTLKEKEGCKHSLYERVCFKEHCESVGLICRGGWWLYHAVAPTPSRRLQFLFSSSWNENSKSISSLSFHELNYVLGKRILIILKFFESHDFRIIHTGLILIHLYNLRVINIITALIIYNSVIRVVVNMDFLISIFSSFTFFIAVW